jgi:hypothetical protein
MKTPAWAKKSNVHTREIQFLPVALLDGLYYVGLCPHLLVEKVVPQDPARNTGVCHQTFTWRYDRCKAENNPGYTGSVNYQNKYALIMVLFCSEDIFRLVSLYAPK